MRTKLFTLFFLFTLLNAGAQTQVQKPRYLQPTDPLVGNWKFNADSSGHKIKAPILAGEEIISILPGLEVCMLAKSYDTKTGKYHTVTYFLVKKDASKLYGEVTESDNPQWAGKLFSFQYEYHQPSDVLVITIGGKKYFYSRTQ